ncbi:hypothetical protein L0F63_005965 [Massospora cicadina]|nr:hypothetical protein L0F63_005965 [Massospora cicadina]
MGEVGMDSEWYLIVHIGLSYTSGGFPTRVVEIQLGLKIGWFKGAKPSALGIVFGRLDITPGGVVDIWSFYEEVAALEPELGATLISPEASSRLFNFATRFPTAKFDLQGMCSLLDQLARDACPCGSGRVPRAATFRSKHQPPSETLSGEVANPSAHLEFPSQMLLHRSLSVSGGVCSLPSRDPGSASLEKASPSNLLSGNTLQSFGHLQSSWGRSPTQLTDDAMPSEPYRDLLADKVIERRQVRVANELNRKLKEAETTMAKMAQEACERIVRLEAEVKANKSEVIQKRRLLFGLRSELRDQTDQIETLELDNSQLRLELSDLKASHLRTKRQLEASHLERLDGSASKSRIAELEELVRGYETSQLDHASLASRCNAMAKTIANLERDVAIAQSVAKNFDALVQENLQLKESVEALQRSLVEATMPPEESRGARPRSSSKSDLSSVDEGYPRSSGGWMFAGFAANPRHVKELERENRYLKRHIDKTWAQWDRVKGDVAALVEAAAHEPTASSRRRLGQAITRMERYRPTKAYPNFKRASIQQVLIDDRPAMPTCDLLAPASPPAAMGGEALLKSAPSPPAASDTGASDTSPQELGSTSGAKPAGIDSEPPSESSGPPADVKPPAAERGLSRAPETLSALPAYLARRANRKACRSVKKLTLAEAPPKTDTFDARPVVGPPTRGGWMDATGLEVCDQVSAATLPASTAQPQKFDDVPSRTPLGPTSTGSGANPAGEARALPTRGPGSYVVLILYAVAAYFLTYWTSTSDGSNSPSRASVSTKPRRGSPSPRSCLGPSPDSRVACDPDSAEPELGWEFDAGGAAYRGHTKLLKFWFERLVLGGTYPYE